MSEYGGYDQSQYGQQAYQGQEHQQQGHEQQHGAQGADGGDWLAGASFSSQGQASEQQLEVSIADIDHGDFGGHDSDTMYA